MSKFGRFCQRGLIVFDFQNSRIWGPGPPKIPGMAVSPLEIAIWGGGSQTPNFPPAAGRSLIVFDFCQRDLIVFGFPPDLGHRGLILQGG